MSVFYKHSVRQHHIMDPVSVAMHVAVIWAGLELLKALREEAAQRVARQRRRNRALRRLQRRQLPERRERRSRIWCREWLQRRCLYGMHENLLAELHKEDNRGFKNFLRMSPELFEEMVEKLTPKLQKKTTDMRHPLSVGLKLAVTLRFMASGCSYADLSYGFRVSKSAISRFVPVVCQAIIDVYMPEVLKCPRTPEEWKVISDGFSRRWNYHNCCGAIDGKHIAIQKPANAGSQFFNYKKFHSIILMAVSDANYKFVYVDIGAEGSAGDAGTWYQASLNTAIDTGTAGFPPAAALPNDDRDIPFHLVGDDAFALKTWLMKPYAHRGQVDHEKIFCYRLSRARRVVENAFGLLVAVFRIFTTTIMLRPSVVKTLTLCGVVLHNLLLERKPIQPNNILVDHEDANHEEIAGAWRVHRAALQGLAHPNLGRNPQARAKMIRDYLAHYYTSPIGAVPWQERLALQNPNY